jgi:hypothetical protein
LIEETVIELSCIGLDPSLYNPLILVICWTRGFIAA